MKRSSGWNQEVTDAQGRRRFHGAFTGGFSAGHFNTVGTEEGWAPSTFVSSRTSRAHVVAHRAEDFMDEEDDPLLGKRLETSEAFDTLNQNEKSRRLEAAAGSDSKHPTFQVPDELILPMTGDSIGKKLLSQMGWKEGHGIGPRMRRRKLSIGSDDGETKAEDNQDDDKGEVYYVPPRNTVDVRVFPKPKTDNYGAGFDPYVDAPEFRQHKLRQEQNSHDHKPPRQIVTFAQALGNGNSRVAASNSRVSMGFGLSALEENDDLDVYDTTSMDDFDRAIGPAGEPIKLLDSMTSSARDKKRHDDTKATAVLCSDGRPALEGFRIASKKLKPPQYTSERLQVPSDFQAYHAFKDSDEEATVSALYGKFNFSTEKSGRGSMMTAKQRAAMLCTEEESSKQPSTAASTKPQAGSVFDLLGPAQREKLMGAAQAARERKPLVQSAPTEQFRANIMASISKRFVSASTTGDASAETSHEDAPVAQEKHSYRSEDPWAPHVLLCKRFRVKCEGRTISGGAQSDELAPDLFTSELAPHLVDLAASRRSASSSGNGGSSSAVPAESKSRGEDEAELPPLPNVPKPSTDLLRSIFEPSDESDVDEDGDDGDAKDSERDWEDKEDAAIEPAVVTSVKADLTTKPMEVPIVSREDKPKDVASPTDDSDSSDDSDDSSNDGDRKSRKHKNHKTKKAKVKKHRKLDDADERRRRKHKKSSRKADGSFRKATKKAAKKKKKKTNSKDREDDRPSRRARSRSRSRSRDRAHSRRA